MTIQSQVRLLRSLRPRLLSLWPPGAAGVVVGAGVALWGAAVGAGTGAAVGWPAMGVGDGVGWKSQRCASLWLPAVEWRLRRDWFTVFSSSRAAVMASRGVPHSIFSGLAMSRKTTFPPRLAWYSISFMP